MKDTTEGAPTTSVEESKDIEKLPETDNFTDEEFLGQVLGPKNVWSPRSHSHYLHVPDFIHIWSPWKFGCVLYLLILILGLPNDLTIYWQQYPWLFGEVLCKGRSFVSEMTSYSSVLTIVAFSSERYLAISFLFAIPFALFTKVNYIDRPFHSGNYINDSAFCALLDSNVYPKSYPIYEISTFLFFIYPMGSLAVLYLRMGIALRQSSNIQRNLPSIPHSLKTSVNPRSNKLYSSFKMKGPTRSNSLSNNQGARMESEGGVNDITILNGDELQFRGVSNEDKSIHTEETDSFVPRVRSDKKSIILLLGNIDFMYGMFLGRGHFRLCPRSLC
ncbi:NMUR1 [Lepeophtheirus salmonis]|uniref:NMUR1 n=1 Tax=Lepeophtheirus salmonis TaxID=72036 RepID=A0A7R8CV80_LEPSM|nr:NMUR1 [Lepeophtheirus salmonis]CAF2907676.1 NMUR1 [Lepeophtheirus salmonis]